MTTRPGQGPIEMLRWQRQKRLCTLTEITRPDGFVMRITDHDRQLTFEGETFAPIIMGALSAERREAALRSGNQEARGIVDGTVVTIPDLLGNRYRGAEVRQIITDWSMPWMVFARHRKWIRNVSWTGSSWVATMEGRTQVLTRPAGGRFGGTFTIPCTYKLGEPNTCKRDIEEWRNVGVRVDLVHDDHFDFELHTDTFIAAYDFGWFRDGDITWRWNLAVDSGNTTSGGSTTGLVDNTKAWVVDEHVGREVRYLTGTGGGVTKQFDFSSYARIVSNTATTLTFEEMDGSYGGGQPYDICDLSLNVDVVSPIVRYVPEGGGVQRRTELLLPTPFPILVGDSGILNVGCDGLFSTCKAKFQNQLNFGGDPFAPSATEIIEPVEGA